MKRSISTFGLLCTSVSAIFGSGWLFATFYAAEAAGPASIIAWILGGFLVIIIGFTFAEICSMFPVSGSTVRISQCTHGNVVTLFYSLIIWVSYVALMIIEVLGVIQYISYFFPDLIKAAGGLTLKGYLTASVLIVVITLINNYSIKWLIRCNTILTVVKIILPVIISVVILSMFFSVENLIHPVKSSFAPFGIHGIFMAISAGGVIFSFNAFKQAADLAGEAKNPNIAVPVALVGSVLICMIVFILLQSAFLTGLDYTNLSNGNWHRIHLSNDASPFASLLSHHKLLWLMPILYIAAFISPFAAALIYCTGGSRALYGIASNGYAPKILTKLNSRSLPYMSIWIDFIIGLIILLFFKNWGAVADFLTCLFAISYTVAPIALISLRFQQPKMNRPLKLPFGIIWSYVAFYICTLFIYWCGWNVLSNVGILIVAVFIAILVFTLTTKLQKIKTNLHWKTSIWLWPYMIGIFLFSYAGNYGNGHGLMSQTTALISIAVFSAVILYISYFFKLDKEESRKLAEHIKMEQ
jgi:amino acid transporter